MIKTVMIVMMLSNGPGSIPIIDKTIFPDDRSCESAKITFMMKKPAATIICSPYTEENSLPPVVVEPQVEDPPSLVATPIIVPEESKVRIIVDKSSKVRIDRGDVGNKAIRDLNLIHDSYRRIPYDVNKDLTREQLAEWFVNDFRPVIKRQIPDR